MEDFRKLVETLVRMSGDLSIKEKGLIVGGGYVFIIYSNVMKEYIRFIRFPDGEIVMEEVEE